ncbi:unnamed protein product [Camellia sinensis]
MEGRGGCCIARYAGGDMSKVDRIMLRFRPIAPKPATGGSVSGSSTNNEVYVGSGGRGKRRYVRDANNNNGTSKRKRKTSSSSSTEETETDPLHKTTSCGGGGGESVSGGVTVVTLPLLPETPDWKKSPVRGGSPSSNHSDLSLTSAEKAPQKKNETIWLNFSNNDDNSSNNYASSSRQVSFELDQTVEVAMPQPVRLLGSIVTVECVTDTWVEGCGLGRTDEERMRNLERDTCPGFISDVLNRVGWTNGAYREMVDHDGGVGGVPVMVWLVMKERVPITYPAFTCKVRLQYMCGKEATSITVPCDVWKMDGGDFVWRLDVKAALSLTLGLGR